jgi:uncharacterized protein YgiM (DUF1202 family)
MILATMIAAGAIAQENTNSLPPIPPPVTSPAAEITPPPAETNLPAAKPAKHKRRKIAATEKTKFNEPPVTLTPGTAEVAVKNLNVRGQPGLKGEFLTHLSTGETVTVLEQINLDKHKANEPAQWAKISFPTNGQVWVLAKYIDATNETVLAKKLNLRAGPSENYSVLGVVERGASVTQIITRGDWMRIEPPTNAYAFVAAMYLKQEASGNLAANPPPSTETEPMTTNTVAEATPIVTETTNMPNTEVNTPPATAVETNVAPEAVETNLPPPPPRVVTHEGVVRHVTSLIEPTAYELFDPKTGGEIDYLYSTTTNLDLSRYKGLHIVVTGEEGLSKRWPKTPVLTIEKIQVAE